MNLMIVVGDNMKRTFTVGQNKWLVVERIYKDFYHIIEVHRCPEVQVGDLMRKEGRGWTAYKSLDSAIPRHTFPTQIDFGGEEE